MYTFVCHYSTEYQGNKVSPPSLCIRSCVTKLRYQGNKVSPPSLCIRSCVTTQLRYQGNKVPPPSLCIRSCVTTQLRYQGNKVPPPSLCIRSCVTTQLRYQGKAMGKQQHNCTQDNSFSREKKKRAATSKTVSITKKVLLKREELQTMSKRPVEKQYL